MTALTADIGTIRSTSAPPPISPVASAARPRRSARSTPATSASARSRSPTTSRPAPDHPRVDRGRPAEHLALPDAAAGAVRRRRHPEPRAGQRHRSSPPTTSPASSGCARCGSRTTAATRRTRSRTGSSRARSRRPASSGFTDAGLPVDRQPRQRAAAAAARAGIRSVVLMPADLEQQKIVTTAVYGGTLVAVEGNYDDVNRLASELAGEHEDWAFVNVNVRPYYAEGSKTLGYEVAEQLGWRLPEQVVIPIASGSQLTKVDKAFRELVALGLVEDTPYKIFGAQATGLLAGVGGVQGGARRRPPGAAGHHRQVAGDRQPGRRALRARRDPAHRRRGRGRHRRGGRRGHPAAGPHRGHLRRDGRRRRPWRRCASCSPAGALDPDAETVIFNTGDGLKTLDAVAPVVGPDGDHPGRPPHAFEGRRPRLTPPDHLRRRPGATPGARRGRSRAPRSLPRSTRAGIDRRLDDEGKRRRFGRLGGG